ncbi:pseudouridine synthase [Sphingomonas citricola]|uniref:pseudouridine synthase n=1 Tax=Sphingomonas citricola TaxID=2862498 RepID=UPI0027E433D6|nr:pseudouridine synthase [Sphingomonas citricola]
MLARAGVASRRDVERMIGDGRVALNGTVIDTPATLLATLDGVTVDGTPVAAPEPTRLFLFHKPAGYLTAARDPAGRPTIYDRLPADLPRLVPVGRLDLNTEGLLLLTTDGEFKRQLELPSTGVERAYRARAYGDVTQAQLEALIDGVEVEGVRYGSIDANLERRTGANVWVEMILTEGKNREVRRVLEYLGLQVSRLIRTRYGPFVLGDLPVGGIGEVRVADLVAFRQSLKAGSRGKPANETTISAPALGRSAPRRATTPARSRDKEAGGNAYDPAATDRRGSATEPDRRLRRAAVASPQRSQQADRRPFRPRDDDAAGARGLDNGQDQRRGRTAPRVVTRTNGDVPRQSTAGHRRDEREAGTRGVIARVSRAEVRQQSQSPQAGRQGRSDKPAPEAEPGATRPVKLQRKPGWAKPKPKAGPRSGKPRK